MSKPQTASALDPVKYNKYLVAFSTLRPEHHTRKPAVYDDLQSHLTINSGLSDIATLATKHLPKKVAMELTTFFSNVGANLPTLSEILADPENCRVPEDPHFQYVIAMAITKKADADTIGAYTKYLARCLPGIAAMSSHDIEAREPTIVTPELKALQSD